MILSLHLLEDENHFQWYKLNVYFCVRQLHGKLNCHFNKENIEIMTMIHALYPGLKHMPGLAKLTENVKL